MEPSQYIVSMATDGARFADVAAAHLAAPVPSCPGWTLADLTYELAALAAFWADVVEHGRLSPDGWSTPARPEEEHLVEWFRRQFAHLERVLVMAEPDQPTWTPVGVQEAAWVIRRMAHETAVHLWDALDATGAAEPIDPALAADGIEEFLVCCAGRRLPGAPAVGGRIELVASDTGGAWRTAGIGEADAVVTGTASDVLLVLWRRLPLDAVQIDGDRSVAERFVAGTDLR